jgi:hypothetical protein
MITASGDSHHWWSLKSPACANVHHLRLSNVARQCCFPLYIPAALWKFSKSRCETKRRHQATKISHRAPPSSSTAAAPPTTPVVLQECPADLHKRSAVIREGPAPSPRGPPPSSARAPLLLPWTAVAPSSAGTPPTVDLLPECRRPSSPCMMTSSSLRAASPTATQEPPPTALPPPLATDASSPPLVSSARMEAEDGVGGAATTASARFVFSFSFLFSKCNYTCIIFNYGLWIVVK